MRSEKVTILLVALMVGRAAAADKSPRELVAEGNQALAASKYDEALSAYNQAAEEMPESAELAYNQGVAYYHKQDYAKAAERFTQSLATRDPALEAKSKFNLGNCAYQSALGAKSDPKKAIEQLKQASGHYRETLDADPKDMDARTNMEMAQRLIKLLIEQQKKEEQEKSGQDQKDDKKDKKDDKKKNSSSQPSSQPNKSDQQKDEEKKGQQQKGDQQKDKNQQKSEKGEQKDGQEKEDQEKKGEEKNAQKGKLESKNEKDDEKKAASQPADQQQMQAVLTTQRAMTPEELERLLQLIREKERQRHLMQSKQMRTKQTPVEKDW